MLSPQMKGTQKDEERQHKGCPLRDFLVVQRLRLCVSTAGGLGLMIPGIGTKIRNAEQLEQHETKLPLKFKECIPAHSTTSLLLKARILSSHRFFYFVRLFSFYEAVFQQLV